MTYRSDEMLTEYADELLTGYCRFRRRQIKEPPIPIEDITEYYLELRIDYVDLCSEYNLPDVLGAISIPQKQIYLDMQLDPVENPHQLGRYLFTLAHEAGHWCLHQDEMSAVWTPSAAHGDICRRDSQDPREVQANKFAACVLMPQEMVFRAWERKYGHLRPVCVDEDDLPNVLDQSRRRRSRLVHISAVLPNLFTPRSELYFRRFAQQFAPAFGVSTQAMQIRLESLGLLQVRTPIRSG